MTKQKKFLTCDGNQAVSVSPYMFQWDCCDLPHRGHLQWQNM